MHYITLHYLRRRAQSEIAHNGVLSLDLAAKLIDAGVNVETFEQQIAQQLETSERL